MRRSGRLLSFLVALLVLVLGCASARAQSFDEGLARLSSAKFEEIEAGIQMLAATADPRAAAVLEAMADGRLLARPDKVLLVKEPDGSVREAASGTATEAGSAKPVRVNNRIRRALDSALGSLTMMSPDPAKRLTAANSIFVHPEPGALAAVEQALTTEQDPAVRSAFERARGALLLEQGTTPEARLEGATILSRYGSPDVLNKLMGAQRALPADSPPELRTALDSAVTAAERRQWLLGMVEGLFQGISLGSVLLLAAIGLAITFGVMGVINMAHGEMVMLGAYTTYVVQEFCRTSWPAGLDYALLMALPLALLVTGGVGILIERGIISRLYGRPLETLLATWGLSLILQQAVRSMFGPNNREVSTPGWMSGLVEVVPGLSLTLPRVVIILFGLAIFALVILIIAKSRFGLEMRAVTQNRRMAASMGIRTPWVDALTFGLGSAIAGIAGVALSQIDNVSPNLGQSYIVDSFMVVVFGGVGNLWGTLSAAMALGIVNKFLEPVAGAVLAKILVLVTLILFIQKRPQGLFALKGRSVEA
jgi:urea transport system permease protein